MGKVIIGAARTIITKSHLLRASLKALKQDSSYTNVLGQDGFINQLNNILPRLNTSFIDCFCPDFKCGPPEPPPPPPPWSRKYGHELPRNKTKLPFCPVPEFPTGIFRCTDDEVVGPGPLGARKGCWYPNPEYYSYHDRSFYDINHHLTRYRLKRPNTNRKPISF